MEMEGRTKLSLSPVMYIEEVSFPIAQKTGALVL